MCELFEGWTTADQAKAQLFGWELTLFGDGHVAIVADEDSAVFCGERANLEAYEHVQQFSLRPHEDEYRKLCRKAATIEARTAAERDAWLAAGGDQWDV